MVAGWFRKARLAGASSVHIGDGDFYESGHLYCDGQKTEREPGLQHHDAQATLLMEIVTYAYLGGGPEKTASASGGHPEPERPIGDGRDTPDTQFTLFEYGKLTLQFEGALWTPYMKKTPMAVRDTDQLPNWTFNSTKIEVLGTRGLLFMGRHGDGWQVFNEEGESILATSPKQSDQEHQEDFVACVRSRRQPNAPAEQGHYSTLLCHLANIFLRVGNKKLAFDAKTETFIGAPEADQLLRRAYRAPWVIPDKV